MIQRMFWMVVLANKNSWLEAAPNQPWLVQLVATCFICSGIAIDSILYLHRSTANGDNYLNKYDIVDSNNGLGLYYISGHNLDDFRMKDYIFFHAHADFPQMLDVSCDVGYRKENNICVDIDECKIMRHYCDWRKRF